MVYSWTFSSFPELPPIDLRFVLISILFSLQNFILDIFVLAQVIRHLLLPLGMIWSSSVFMVNLIVIVHFYVLHDVLVNYGLMFLTFAFLDDFDHSTHIFHILKKGGKSPVHKPILNLF